MSFQRFFLYIGIFIGVLAVPSTLIAMFLLLPDVGQIRRDREFEAKLQPTIDFVHTFQNAKHRLPSDKEFAARPSAKTDSMVDLVTKGAGNPPSKVKVEELQATFA